MYRLSIVTPEKVVYEEDVASIIAPGTVGYLGILSNHAPIITSLKPGVLNIKDNAGSEINFAISGGFLENSSNICTILADSAEFANEIDLERARESLARAKQRLQNAAGEIDTGRAEAAFERAKNRVTLAKKD
ncbi:MAG: F0F1 ATP synthase subunit epsilon [candidate division Zixibacteria bacterium]|nr:F0F1 ATP synthase subunit epsilon [candidate division Zixibacteria bacterium]